LHSGLTFRMSTLHPMPLDLCFSHRPCHSRHIHASIWDVRVNSRF